MVQQVDAQLLKRKLAGTGKDSYVNCAIASDGRVAYLKIDKVKTPKKLESELLKELSAEGVKPLSKYFGTLYADAFPGVLVMSLNRPVAAGIRRSLTSALRGSGYSKIMIEGAADSDEI